MKSQNETIITPQWVTVKETILEDFFELANDFSNWKSKPNSHILTQKWTTSLTSLYLKVRLKVINKTGFEKLNKDMDNYLINPKSLTYSQLIENTIKLCEFIESTGITNVEQETMDPVTDFINKSFT